MGTYGFRMATNIPFEERVRLRVAAAINQAGETSTSIADATGIARTTLQRRLKDSSSAFGAKELGIIALHLGVKPASFTNDEAA